MSILLTAEKLILWLALGLSVFACLYWAAARTGGRGPAYFSGNSQGSFSGNFHERQGEWRKAAVLAAFGLFLGMVRTEACQWKIGREEAVFLEAEGRSLSAQGTVAEIKQSGYGWRLTLEEVSLKAESEKKIPGKEVSRIFCYVDNTKGLRLGNRIEVFGEAEGAEQARNPGGFDFRGYCRSVGVCGILSADGYGIVSRKIWPISQGLFSLRQRLSVQLSKIAEPLDAGIYKAVLLGEKEDLDEELYGLYQENGISHLLAISGLHVSLLGLSLWKILRKFGLSFFAAGMAAGCFLALYGLMVGNGASVVRAVTMMALSFGAGIVGRTYDMASAMCVPAGYLLLMNPFLLTQPGFQLSFLAVGAVCFPAQALIDRFSAKGLFQSFLVSGSIQLMTAPVILYHFFSFPLYGVILNLLVIPLMPLAAVSGGLGLFLSFLWPEGGVWCLGAGHGVLRLYEALCRLTGSLPFSSLVLGRPKPWQMAAFYLAAFAGLGLCLRGTGRKGKETGLLLLLLPFLFLTPFSRQGLSVTFLDVGQGDGIFLEHNGKTVLVDCGSSQKRNLGEDCLVPFLQSKGIGRIDTVVITHGDQDHMSGIQYLLTEGGETIRIGRIVLPAAGWGDSAYGKIEEMAAERKIPVEYVKAGDRLESFGGRGLFQREEGNLSCLYPGERPPTEDRNDHSLVLLAEYGNFRLLLTGDMSAAGEKELAAMAAADAAAGKFPVTVLKAAHHGSASSSSEEFLRVFSPRNVILSYGKGNSYGHPSPEVVERFQKLGAKIYKTEKDGAITAWTDGRRFKIRGFLTEGAGFGIFNKKKFN